jgi:hypothetical protein
MAELAKAAREQHLRYRIRTRQEAQALSPDRKQWSFGIRYLIKTDQKLMGTRFMVMTGGSSMTEQIKNPEGTKVVNDTVSEAAARKRIDRVAEKAAEKSSRTEQNYDQGHQIISK